MRIKHNNKIMLLLLIVIALLVWQFPKARMWKSWPWHATTLETWWSGASAVFYDDWVCRYGCVTNTLTVPIRSPYKKQGGRNELVTLLFGISPNTYFSFLDSASSSPTTINRIIRNRISFYHPVKGPVECQKWHVMSCHDVSEWRVMSLWSFALLSVS